MQKSPAVVEPEMTPAADRSAETPRPELLLERIERDLRALRAAIGVKSACDQPALDHGDLISVEAAAEIARCRQDTVRSWAREQPAETGGFGLMLGSRWWIIRGRYIDYLRRKQK